MTEVSGNSGFQVGAQAPVYYESHVSPFMAPFVDALVRATVNAGDHVLDVACGTGVAARAASQAAGADGRVTGLDINPGMLAKAREIGAAQGDGIAWEEASVAELPFEDESFDAVISQQGLQFFPDKAGSLREMARVARKGGRIGATVWAPEGQTPYLDAIFGLLAERCGGDPGANRVWRVDGGEEQVTGWFEEAGLAPVSIELVEAVVTLPPPEAYVVDHVKALPPPSVGQFFDMSGEAQAAFVEEVRSRLAEHATTDGLAMPFRSYLATVVKPV